MKIIDCIQGSEEWDRWRLRPTASNFGRIVTPVKGGYSKSAVDYACEIVAKELGVFTEPPPSYWMEYGTENEPNAIASYEATTGNKVQRVGFVLPDHTEAFGGSPDGLVSDNGLLETKCPKPETLIGYHAAGEMPAVYKPQVQGLLLITGCEWCDFFAWHSELEPFHVRVLPDAVYQASMLEALCTFLAELKRIRGACKRRSHADVLFPNVEEVVL